MFHFIYNDIIYRPLLNLLVFFYHYIPDIGVAIILLTLLIRLILAPSFHKSLKSQTALSALQPKLNEIREKYKNDKEGQAKATMGLYKEHKINPFSSCLPLIIQLPILIALYQVFRKALGNHLVGLYSFVPQPEHINSFFLHFLDLSKTPAVGGHWYLLDAKWYLPGLALALITGLTQIWQSKLTMPKNIQGQDSAQRAMSMNMVYFMPLMIIYIAFRLQTGLSLYWTVTTLFSVAQQYYILRKNPKTSPNTN